jgi:hypothetical protein
MLRFDHMPSDFNPTFLILGEREDLSALARLLRGFSQKPGPVNVRTSIPDAGGRAELTIVPGEGPDAPYGLRATAEDNHFTWMLNPWQAEQIGVRIEALTPPELKSGNDIVELGLEGEIPVKISRGEFTNNFLTPQHHLDPDYQGEAPTDS